MRDEVRKLLSFARPHARTHAHTTHAHLGVAGGKGISLMSPGILEYAEVGARVYYHYYVAVMITVVLCLLV